MSNPDEHRSGGDRDWSVVVEDGIAKSNEPVSSAVADPAATTRRHEPHEPPRQPLPEKLYKPREPVHNKRVRGPFRTFKWLVMLVTLGIYYVTPWIRWDRGPYAPDQAVLIDLANRRFYFFFIEIWPQEFFYIAGLLVMAGIGLCFIFCCGCHGKNRDVTPATLISAAAATAYDRHQDSTRRAFEARYEGILQWICVRVFLQRDP